MTIPWSFYTRPNASAKPREEQVLVRTIERACSNKSRLQNPALQTTVARIGHLPSLPEIYRHLVEELEFDSGADHRSRTPRERK